MGKTKQKLREKKTTLGGWIMIGHPTIVELYAEEFDWICVDLEHTCISLETFSNLVLAAKGTGCDVLARLSGIDSTQAKAVLDAGADGIIVPDVRSGTQAEKAVSMARFAPKGTRGSSLCRASNFGKDFFDYQKRNNKDVIVVVMIESIEAVKCRHDILNVEGLDAVLIGPYDLSASLGLNGQLQHEDVIDAQRQILESCRRNDVNAGIHIPHVDPGQLVSRIEEGYRFIACGLDTEFIIHGCREMKKNLSSHV